MSVMRPFKIFFLVLALVAASNTQAAVFNLGTLADGSVTPFQNSGSVGYNDDWQFSVTTNTTLNFYIEYTGFIEFGEYSLFDSTGTVLMSGGLGFSFAQNATDSAIITPGDYRLNIQLYANSGLATYDGKLGANVPAVPEPSTWLLMIGGLGSLLMLRKRRA